MFECRGCGVVMKGRRARVYCSNACQQRAARRLLVGEWLATGVGRADSKKGHYVRSYLMQDQGGTCALCGIGTEWNGALLGFVLDHVDGDADNNRREQLCSMCL